MTDQMPQSQVETWNAAVAAKKAMWFLGKILAALLTALIMSQKVQALLTFAGVPLTPVETQVIAASLSGMILEMIHDYLKVKTGWGFL